MYTYATAHNGEIRGQCGRGQFSPSTMEFLGIELKSSDLAAAILYAEPGSHIFFSKTGLSLCNPAYLELTEILMSQLPNC